MLLKSKESGLDRETFAKHVIDGGLMQRGVVLSLEAYSSPDLGEVVKKLEPYFELTDALEQTARPRTSPSSRSRWTR